MSRQEGERREQFRHVTREEIRTLPLEQLAEIWRQNHELLRHLVREGFESGALPFFGMHGTSQENAQQVLASPVGHIEFTTFYEKDASEDFLFKLYSAAFYTVAYASNRRIKQIGEALVPGKVLILNLQRGDGRPPRDRALGEFGSRGWFGPWLDG